eukprot:7483873-Pyramimonas_sp.AAC.1
MGEPPSFATEPSARVLSWARPTLPSRPSATSTKNSASVFLPSGRDSIRQPTAFLISSAA